jgi:acetyl-CoA synthetase/medium-chain acyl-CoA synthetase
VEIPEFYNFAVDVMERWASLKPDGCALWWVDPAKGTERRITFLELKHLTHRAASFFQSLGIRKGDRVSIMLPRVPNWWLAMLGLTRLGAVPVPSTPLLADREVQYRIQSAQISAVITDAESAHKFSHFPGIRIVAGSNIEGWMNLETGMASASAQFEGPATRGADPGILYFTSATTGNPKMVLHTQVSYGLAHESTARLWLDLRSEDVHWNLSDVGWAKAAWSSFFAPWHAGACVFAADLRGRFDPVQALEILATYPITTWCSPPTALRLIIRENLSKWTFPHLRHCVSAGEPLNPEIVTAWLRATGLTIYEAYGQTETVVLIGNYRCMGHEVKPGSMGKATPEFDLVIVDERLKELPDGEEGEIAIRISSKRPRGLFQEYWQNPSENARQFRNGWYLTGDRAVRDADGYFWFIGRQDDVIKSAGYRIGPFEVENALMEHPAVLDVAAVGKPDPIRGQIVKAFVVLREGYESADALKAELQQHCKRVAAPYKYPREIEFVPDLPKTTSGKTRRVELRLRG